MATKKSAAKAENATSEVKKEEALESTATSNNVVVALNYPTRVIFTLSNGHVVTLLGNGESLRGKERGVLPVGAYGLTAVNKDDWELLQKEYGHMRMFKNGLCFASKDTESAKDEAEEKKELRSGLEPVSASTGKTTEASSTEV